MISFTLPCAVARSFVRCWLRHGAATGLPRGLKYSTGTLWVLCGFSWIIPRLHLGATAGPHDTLTYSTVDWSESFRSIGYCYCAATCCTMLPSVVLRCKVRDVFIKRSRIIQFVRDFLQARDFIEVRTSRCALQPSRPRALACMHKSCMHPRGGLAALPPPAATSSRVGAERAP